jgi:transposase
MRRFVEEADRGQWTLLPECLDDFIDESNPVRAIDVFVDALDLAEMSFEGVEPAATGRPSYHPAVLLKLYIYGYLNRVQSSRRLEREAGRNVEVMWLLGRLAKRTAPVISIEPLSIEVTTNLSVCLMMNWKPSAPSRTLKEAKASS